MFRVRVCTLGVRAMKRGEPMSTERGSRPVGVTLVSVFIVISGLFLVVNGVLGLVNGGNGPAGIVVSIIILIVGVIYLLVAKGVWNGNVWSRLIVTVLTVIALLGSIAAMFTEDGQFLVSVVQVIIAVIILALLYSGKARQFFG
jgi:hypothetical protein